MADNPFSGLKLSEQTPGRGRDSVLLRTPQAPTEEAEPIIASKEERKKGTKVETHQTTKVNHASLPRRKAGYRITEEAIYAVAQMKVDLQRSYGVKASLESIVEEAILMIREDFEKGGEKSRLVKNLSSKVKR